jgi:hypothetical protein
MERRTIPKTGDVPGRVVITDPDLLASLRLSPEARERIERLERAQMAPRPRIVLD